MSEAEFELAYQGGPVEDGSMDVFDLGPALLSAGRLIERANDVVNGDTATVDVRVKTAPPPGSFPVDLQVFVDFGEQTAALSHDAQHILFMLGLLADVGERVGYINNLIELYKLLMGREPNVIEDDEEDTEAPENTIKIEIDGEHNHVDINVAQLYKDSQIRGYLRDTAAPLSREGMESVEARDVEGNVVNQITKEEAEAIQRGEEEEGHEELGYGTFTDWFYVVPKSWDESGAMWYFDNQKGLSFLAPIEDEGFWRNIHEGEFEFGEYTQLRVRARWHEEPTDDDGIRTRYAIESVMARRTYDDPQLEHPATAKLPASRSEEAETQEGD